MLSNLSLKKQVPKTPASEMRGPPPTMLLAALLAMSMILTSNGLYYNASNRDLGSIYYQERNNIFDKKIMPSQYIKHNKTVDYACQCRNLCLAMVQCLAASWIRMTSGMTSSCLISETYFSHLELINIDPGVFAATTFHWFKSDYKKGQYKYYKVHEALYSFSQANNACRSEGAQLATSVDALKKADMTVRLYQGVGAQYWIGLYQEGPTAQAMWLSPNGNMSIQIDYIPGTSNCYSLYNVGTWIFMNQICTLTNYGVCERNF
ncbi:uncharacterized protein LOC135204485 [Macrobrachium nipponense]|uniref:uncharacterized protein LOC135204485 n=1 Tax=Macrobrachium nipponense TaxID=159736 RepID=UPI0030C89D25